MSSTTNNTNLDTNPNSDSPSSAGVIMSVAANVRLKRSVQAAFDGNAFLLLRPEQLR